MTSLNIAHTSWISKASIDDESSYTSQWPKSCWDEVGDLNTQVDRLSQVDTHIKPTVQQQMDILTEQLDSLQKNYSSKLDTLLAKTDSASTANLSLTLAS